LRKITKEIRPEITGLFSAAKASSYADGRKASDDGDAKRLVRIWLLEVGAASPTIGLITDGC
jgi:hypothetical protein